MSKVQFEFAEYLDQVNSLRTRLLDVLRVSDDDKVASLIGDVPTITSSDDGVLLTLAFIGQYNAGKSTIISALTKKRDIPIDADVCTDKVTGYDWEAVHTDGQNTIRLLDTPGIHAGYPDHDELTYQTIDKADLLVFVVTSELFDDVIGPHFRDLAFKRDKAREILLVVNKMGMSPGTPEVKRPHLAEVTKPLAVEDFGTVFIDARSYLEGLEETDAKDQQELFDIADFDRFVKGLNKFVSNRRLTGRLTTPLFLLRSVAQQAEAYLASDMPEERAAIELLGRKRSLFYSSRARLHETLRGLINAVTTDITTYGDEVAETIEPGSTEESVQAQHENAQKRVEERCSQLEQGAKSAIEKELQGLDRQLEELYNGVLAQELRGQVLDTSVQSGDDFGKMDEPKVEWTGSGSTEPTDWPVRLQKVSDIAKHLGKYAANWTTGPFAQAAQFGSATAARGSQGHQVIYNVGKFLGVKFKPWGAVNVARHMGNAARVINVVGGVLSVIAQIQEEKQQEKHRRQLRDARDSIRQDYRDAVRAIEVDFWATYEEFSQNFYDGELSAIDASRDELVGPRRTRTEAANLLGQVASEAQALIQEIQSGAAGHD